MAPRKSQRPFAYTVFTIPDILNPLTLRNKEEIYSMLFKASAESLKELSSDPKYLGAQIGFISILHTGGQNLMDHPHIHSIVTGGGLSLDENRWMSSRKDFFLPVKVLSKKFKSKFLYYLKQAYYGRKLKFTQNISNLSRYKGFQNLIDELYEKEWVVYVKPPFRSPKYVLEYLGRYTHRVAISNNRITKIDDNKVTFKWKDYKDNNKIKFMTLDAFEFVRRFLLHILPYRFVKIRHYGILSNKNRNSKLRCCKELLGVAKGDKDRTSYEYDTWEELLLQLTGIDITKCPCCSKGRMIRKRKIEPRCYSPPTAKDLTA